MKKSKQIRLMGTTIDLTITHPAVDRVLEEVEALLKMYEKRFSANDPASELSHLNQLAGIRPVNVHPELYELIAIGKKHSAAPNSYLNIAIGPLVQMWRIGFSDAKKPSDTEIKKILKKIDVDQVLLLDNSVYLESKGVAIDLGALAKGYIADRIIDYLRAIGAESALINLGGNLVTMGAAIHHADELWRVGIRNPMGNRKQSQIILKVRDQSVVTSGIYERQLTTNDAEYHHIFDPRTGYPIETAIVSLTIISDQSIDGEIWTSRLFGQSVQDILTTVKHLPGIECIIINKQGLVSYSDGVYKFLA